MCIEENMITSKFFSWFVHNLGSGCEFKSGNLPEDLIWDEPTFDAAWSLHPEDKHEILIHGRLVKTPRWQQAYATDYHYTGRVNAALPTPRILDPLLEWAQREISAELNGILLNWYQGPGHYIGPHHDSIRNMIEGSPIVTISFGETRVFRLTQGVGRAKVVRNFPAPNGTIFLMPFNTNLAWKHGVPKSTKYVGRRISVTLRAFKSRQLS
jgi:alkylated DNA repair dioxygenase AlkB